MGYRIRLLPSGREFVAEAQESLLEAALRSGVNLPYNCSGGSCGVCKARLVNGQPGAARFHDYSFSEVEKQNNYLLLCSVSAASDMELEVHEIDDVHSIPHQRIATRVARLEPVGERFFILTLRTPRTQTLQFLAGQHVQLRIGDEYVCDAAIASCPCNGMYLQFHLLRHPPEGAVAAQAFARLRLNDVVEVNGPYGEFTLDEDSPRPIALVAQDVGFAAIKSLLEHGIALELSQPVDLFWLSTEPEGHYLDNLCRSWSDALDNFRFHPLRMTGDNAAEAAAAVLARLPAPAQCDVYLSADAEVGMALGTAFLAQGTPRERIFMMEMRQCGFER